MNINSFITKDYRKNDDFTVRINKPNSNPISQRVKIDANVFVTKDYENETTLRPQKNKPNSKPILERMNVNFYAAGYYRRVLLVPLNEHIDIIYQRFFASDVVIILNL